VGLLDKAEKIVTSAPNQSGVSSSEPKTTSLLEKAKKFLKEDVDQDWIGDLSDIPAEEIPDDLPIPDGEEEFDLSELGDFPSDFEEESSNSKLDDEISDLQNDDLIDFEDDALENSEPFEENHDDNSIPLDEETNTQDTIDDPMLSDEKPSSDSEIDPTNDSLIETTDEPKASLPEVDIFEDWEKDAVQEAAKQPIQPVEEDKVPQDKNFLFDDESDFSTAPMGQYIASKKRIENYQAVFEITKEIAASKDFADFFDNLVFSIIGQVGCSSVVILTSTNPESEKWDALNAEGVELQDNWSFMAGDEVYQRLSDTDTVIYAGELKQRKLPERESKILNEMESEILVPIRHKETCYGILSLGKLINNEEYIVDDLEFVKVIGDIAGSVFSRVAELEKQTDEVIHLKQVIEVNESVLKSARDFASIRKMDDAYDLLIDNIKKKLGVKQFSFLVLDSESRSDYIVFGSNFILPDRAKDFKLGKDSDIVGMVSNVAGVYRLENFREDSELKSIFTNDELAIMSEFTILPIINLNWLVGMIIIHSTSTPWTDMTRDVAVAIMETSAPVLANLLILSEKEALFRNPFNPLESKILSEIEKAEQLKLSFTCSLFKIQNVARITHLFGAGKFARYADTLRKTIMEHISENDFFTRVGQGKFAIVLHGKDREETEIVIKKIKAAFLKKEEFFSSTFKPSYRILSLSYPNDTKDKNQFLEMIEEA